MFGNNSHEEQLSPIGDGDGSWWPCWVLVGNGGNEELCFQVVCKPLLQLNAKLMWATHRSRVVLLRGRFSIDSDGNVWEVIGDDDDVVPSFIPEVPVIPDDASSSSSSIEEIPSTPTEPQEAPDPWDDYKTW